MAKKIKVRLLDNAIFDGVMQEVGKEIELTQAEIKDLQEHGLNLTILKSDDGKQKDV